MVENLKYLRTKFQLSQQQLADKIESTQQSIQGYETGYREPDIEMLKRMASYFHTSVDFLIGYVPEPTDGLKLTAQEYNILSHIQQLPEEARNALEIFLMTHKD